MTRTTLAGKVELHRGQSYRSALLDEPGPYLLGLGTIARNGGFSRGSLRTYGGESPERILLRPGDLYLSLKDVTHKAELLGAVARVPADVPLGRLTQDTVRIQITSPEVDADYLYWLLRSPHYRAYCKMRGTGTTNLDLSRSDFLGYEFLLPAISEQQAIAEVLGALDDKIAANAALVERADELMHRTFCSLTSVHETPLSTTAEFVNGRAFTKGASGTGRVVVRIAELNSGIGGSTVFSDAVVDDKHLARPGDILFAWSGSLTLHRWFRDEAIVNQHIFKVIPRDGHHAWLVYELLRQKLADFKAIAADKATTMGHIQRHHLDEVVGIPSSSDIDRLNPLMSALWSLALNAEQHSLTLAATRDALLPQLMSGKLRVRDAEAAASEAGA